MDAESRTSTGCLNPGRRLLRRILIHPAWTERWGHIINRLCLLRGNSCSLLPASPQLLIGVTFSWFVRSLEAQVYTKCIGFGVWVRAVVNTNGRIGARTKPS